MNNIEDKSERHCTGCGACVCICPVKAISYKINDNGFYQAFVDSDKCIKCGKCKKVCARFMKDEEFGEDIKKGTLYSVKSKKSNVIETCTSGGIAYEIAKHGIENGYYIIGTVYNYKTNEAEMSIAKTIDEIEKYKGSKYIQSSTADVYGQMLEICREDCNSKFIVFGMPCQILGLSKLLEKNKISNEVIKIDLFCHGVPSYLVWEKYLKEKEFANIEMVNFRSKHFSWHDFCIEIKDKNGYYYGNSENDDFYKAFFDNILLNKACFTCKSRKEYSEADIRLGDFWGKRYINNDKGISAVVVVTDKGKAILEDINDKIELISHIDIEECLKRQSVEDYPNQKLSEWAFGELKKNSLNSTIKMYRRRFTTKKKIKIKLKECTRVLPISLKKKLRIVINKWRKF